MLTMANAAFADTCVPKVADTATGLPEFEDDDYFDHQVRKSDDGSAIRITGDIVIIDSARMQSLVANPAYAKTKIKKLIFDARILRIRGPISIEGGDVSLLAERLTFEKGGRIVLMPGATNEPRSLRIATEEIGFVGGGKRPITVNANEGGVTKVSILVSNTHGAIDKAALWGRFSDSLESSSIPPSVAIKTDGEAQEELLPVFRSEMQWPLFFAAKVRKHFSQTPFDDRVRKKLMGITDEYMVKLKSFQNPLPFALVESTRAAIRNNSDLNGHTSSFTPKRDLTTIKGDIDAKRKSNLFDNLIQIATNGEKRAAASKVAIDQNRKALDIAKVEVKNAEAAIERLNGQLAKAGQDLSSNSALIEQLTASLKRMSDDQYKKSKDAQSVKQWAAVGAAAVATAASMGLAAPAVAAGAAAGISITGSMIYSHNAHAGMTALDVANAGLQAYKATQDFQSAWSETKAAKDDLSKVFSNKTVLEGAAPQEGKPDTRTPYTKTGVTAAYLYSLTNAVNKAKAIGSQELAAPTVLSLDERLAQDESMRDLLAKQAALTQSTAFLAADIVDQTSKLEVLTSKGMELQNLDELLRAANSQNDQQMARWNAIVSALWSREVEQIAGLLSMYRRSLLFESGRTPDGVQDVLSYPNELSSEIAAGVLDMYGGVGSNAPEATVRANMDLEKTKFLSSVDHTVDAIGRTYDDYLTSRNEADTYRRVVRFRADAVNDVHRNFIRALNGQIVQQIVGKSKVGELLPAYIPYELPQGVNQYPERLITAKIIDVEFESAKKTIGPGALDFVVLHPSYGEMRHANGCYLVDFRAKPTDWREFTTPFDSVQPGWAGLDPLKVTISKNQAARYYTYYPARTPYHLLVNVTSKNWKSIPKIKEIVIGLEIMQ